ncbi:DNA polymerase III subunit delta' [Helicobacter marmotae]|uniref:DNA polymerase III subunit delta n=1 Tax=Helicobacter marmotae TaxID=152490 RepID=A0A3D8I427_9HELI|nr:DNA polymerase III subunit delta' [Helicobacter marmotae]RDU59281.1 DNA polymerase III subunit delta' [Helicobacter marmotae]
MIGLIHITPFIDELIDELTLECDEQYYEVFQREDFKIDDAKDVIAKAYLSYEQEMRIIIAANKYNIAAQNALLKITEEPPENITFIIIAKNKNALIPTIRSRMRLIAHKHKAPVVPFELDVKKLSLQDIYEFCKHNDRSQQSKEEIKMRIQSLLFALFQAGIKLNQKELALFDKAIALNQNDATEKQNYIFLPLLLRIYQKQKKKP